MKSDDEVIIEIKDIHKTFASIEAVRGVSLNIRRGEVVVIIGPSGSGKSTLLRCINHLEAINKGSITVDGIPLGESRKNINKIRQEVGMVFQQFNLFPHLTVLENVCLPQRVVRRKSRAEAERIARDLLEKVGIPEKADSIPGQLSGGQQQRVAIARALVNEPAIILADEPTGNLDSRSGKEIIELLLSLNKERGTTLILVTHAPDVAEKTQRIIRIRDGVVEEAA